MTKAKPHDMHHVSEMFQAFRARFPGNDVAWLRECRAHAMTYVNEHGFPGSDREDWKYTTLPSWLRDAASPAFYDINGITSEALDALGLVPNDVHALVFVNGSFAASLSTDLTTIPDCQVTTLGQIASKDEARIAPMLNAYSNGVEALNTAFLTDGLVLSMTPGAVLETPLYLLHLASSHGIAATHSTHHILEIGHGAKCRVIERFVALQDGPYWTNHRKHVTLGNDAELSYLTMQQEGSQAVHCDAGDVVLASHARFTHHQVSLGGTCARMELQVGLNGLGAETSMSGVFLGRDGQHLDHSLPVIHASPSCTSSQHYKGVLDDHASGVFYGHVTVAKGADKTVAKQRNHNLLLSDKAVCYSRPVLDINTDDVQCSHGSATGALDPAQLFYLRSRGIPKGDAMQLLLEGYITDVFSELTTSQEAVLVHDALQAWLIGG